MASSDTFCVFCNTKNEKLILFTETTLKNCIEILKIRKTKHFKYHDVELPSSVNVFQGYHHKCYKTFTALKSKYKTVNATCTDSEFLSCTQTSSSKPSTSKHDRYLNLSIY